MLRSAFPLAEEIELRTVEFVLHPVLWQKYDLSAIDLDLSNWTTIRYLNDAGTGFHPDVETLPNDTGGLYLFSINCPVIKGRTEFPAYIGRAQFTPNQNLRKRCRTYFTKYSRDDERPLITKMFRYWAENLLLSYMTFDDNDDIKDFEKKLINSLLLPFNDEIPDTEIGQAVSAF